MNANQRATVTTIATVAGLVLVAGIVLLIVDMNNVPQLCTPSFTRGEICVNGSANTRGIVVAVIGLIGVIAAAVMSSSLSKSNQRSTV
ncbi:hypothetical protein CH253_07965 [Rhodococcus sp. 06-156-3C]|uniref:hypothetical protein n=1 Tax=Rhodococcus sp. 06-156-3C TaxID=2022486 RepID=UPI000B9C478D|nr:hypothetical protein [Rhodococcus sp. 06-156-3C]OZD23788.1 hypothetical protein CH253_07965 [Rhodococcus sp. 06-156-3C]